MPKAPKDTNTLAKLDASRGQLTPEEYQAQRQEILRFEARANAVKAARRAAHGR